MIMNYQRQLKKFSLSFPDYFHETLFYVILNNSLPYIFSTTLRFANDQQERHKTVEDRLARHKSPIVWQTPEGPNPIMHPVFDTKPLHTDGFIHPTFQEIL